ncbi:MAG TPA: sugar phosphate nucleotidyltransferase, partial [Terriglobales bacterium]|nr:sugar phosphate nucleotidyltransferase [Terriglobales bacterium]
CGGLGTRLRGTLGPVPKALAPVARRPFLAHLLDQLAGCNLERVVLCTGAGAEPIREFVSLSGNKALEVSRESSPLGTGGALRHALPLLRGNSVLVLNGDSLVPGLDFNAFWACHQLHPEQACFVLVAAGARTDAGNVALDASGRIAVFSEKATAARTQYHSAGVYLLPKALIAAVPVGRACSLEHELVPQWLQQGIYGFVHPGELLDIGTPERLRQADVRLRELALGK